ncbi:MAG: hypothetical protein US49_C0005G0067 [candidate division TM6 bacterium GW2011_GWF2_37_49]|nr:MAG: hypothetical protein US49_C0005G0067 [candidate division TM6 bacterium GW2011_GWF2_37_49]
MNELLKNLENGLSLFVGSFCILIGIAGLFLPILPGILIIMFGLYVIGGKHLIKKIKNWLVDCTKK